MTICRIKLSVEMEFLQWRRDLGVLLGSVGVVVMVAWARISGAVPNQASEKRGSFVKDHINHIARKSFLEQLGKGFNSELLTSEALLGSGVLEISKH